MSQVFPLNRIGPAPPQARFEIALPNPILGKSYFLLLPRISGWRYKVAEETLVAHRHLILKDRMWVREGKATFKAFHDGETGFPVFLKISSVPFSRFFWKPDTARQSAGIHSLFKPSFSLFFRREKKDGCARFYCEATKRRLELRWKLAEDEATRHGWKDILQTLECH